MKDLEIEFLECAEYYANDFAKSNRPGVKRLGLSGSSSPILSPYSFSRSGLPVPFNFTGILQHSSRLRLPAIPLAPRLLSHFPTNSRLDPRALGAKSYMSSDAKRHRSGAAYRFTLAARKARRAVCSATRLQMFTSACTGCSTSRPLPRFSSFFFNLS